MKDRRTFIAAWGSLICSFVAEPNWLQVVFLVLSVAFIAADFFLRDN